MKTKKPKYFNFPIQLLTGFMNNHKEVLENIMSYSIYEQSLKFEQFGTFENPNLEFEIFKNCAEEFYGIKLNDDYYYLANLHCKGSKAHNQTPENPPKVGLELSVFWEFCNNEKKDFDKICLLAFLSIKSILGKKQYCKVTNNYWLSRMNGNAKAIGKNELSPEIEKYSTRHYLQKIKYELSSKWGLVHYAQHTTGFYVSYKLELQPLMTIVESNKRAYKEKLYKEKEKEILKEVLRILDLN